MSSSKSHILSFDINSSLKRSTTRPSYAPLACNRLVFSLQQHLHDHPLSSSCCPRPALLRAQNHVITSENSPDCTCDSRRVVRAHSSSAPTWRPRARQIWGRRALIWERRADTCFCLEGTSHVPCINVPLNPHPQCSVILSLLAELTCVLLDTYPHHYHLPLRITKYLPQPSHETALPAIFVLGCLATAASGALRWTCYRTLGSLFTFELTLREDHRLVTSGPYGFVRHPSYSGVVLGVVGTLLVHFGPGSWWARVGWTATPGGQLYALCWCAMEAYVLWSILCRAPTEDAFLRKQFGAEWDAWAARVCYRVIPGVF